MKTVKKTGFSAWVFATALLLLLGLAYPGSCSALRKAAPIEELRCTRGMITGIDEGGVTVTGEGYYPEVRLVLENDTLIAEGSAGDRIKKEALKKGVFAAAYYGPAASRSLPPSSLAKAVIICPEGVEPPLFVRALKVDPAEGEKAVRVTCGDMVLTIAAAACEDYAAIRAGDTLLVWCKALTLSLPALGYAEKAVIVKKPRKGNK